MIKAIVLFACEATMLISLGVFLMRIPERDVPPGSSMGE